MNLAVVILQTTLVLICATLVFCVFMMVRNQWVYRQRQRLINEFYDERRAQLKKGLWPSSNEEWDDHYLSYDEMLYRFWIWDVSKLRRKS